MSHAQRLARVRESFDRYAIDACLISQPESRYYLSGYTGHDLPPRDSAGYLLISRDEALLLTDPRTSEQAEREAVEFEVKTYGGSAAGPEAVAEAMAKLGVARIGFESVHLPHGIWSRIRENLPDTVALQALDGLVDDLRIIKDADELRHLQEAIDVVDRCLASVFARLEPGLTERAIARMIEQYLIEHADGPSFPSIVASGPNGSVPHAAPSDRRIQAGEAITIDIGARAHGYCSDTSRTVCLGEPSDPRLVEIYDIVLRAQIAAERAVRPGLTGREADALARDVIAAAGHAEHFTHATGHGIGLEVHEPPRVGQLRADDVLRPGMVFSVEPGIYIPGWGGVRIEDLVVLEDDGARVLCHAPKDLTLSPSPRTAESAGLFAGGNA